MQYALNIQGLSHRFSKDTPILDNLDLQVPTGSIYGFLGPNGAGKTTTLKLILGLLKPQSAAAQPQSAPGSAIQILGLLPSTDRLTILRQIGSLIETPSLYGHLTAAENLEIWRRIYRSPKEGHPKEGIPKQRIPEVLKLVGLDKTGNKKTRQFSLGMKQRLSIAVAILHKPNLLILDEPTNGLDPVGMIEIRKLLRRLNQEEGMTILLSSHLLSEIARLVTHVGIINNGRLIFQDTLPALLEKSAPGGTAASSSSSAPGADLESIFIDLINQE